MKPAYLGRSGRNLKVAGRAPLSSSYITVSPTPRNSVPSPVGRPRCCSKSPASTDPGRTGTSASLGRNSKPAAGEAQAPPTMPKKNSCRLAGSSRLARAARTSAPYMRSPITRSTRARSTRNPRQPHPPTYGENAICSRHVNQVSRHVNQLPPELVHMAINLIAMRTSQGTFDPSVNRYANTYLDIYQAVRENSTGSVLDSQALDHGARFSKPLATPARQPFAKPLVTHASGQVRDWPTQHRRLVRISLGRVADNKRAGIRRGLFASLTLSNLREPARTPCKPLHCRLTRARDECDTRIGAPSPSPSTMSPLLHGR